MRYYGIIAAALAVLGIGSSAGAVEMDEEVYCREYQQEVMVGGRLRSSYGTACQQPDGAWKVVTTDVPVSEPTIEYTSVPHYLTQPQLVVPPPAYYTPAPYYAPYAYPGAYVQTAYGRGYRGRHFGHHHSW